MHARAKRQRESTKLGLKSEMISAFHYLSTVLEWKNTFRVDKVISGVTIASPVGNNLTDPLMDFRVLLTFIFI